MEKEEELDEEEPEDENEDSDDNPRNNSYIEKKQTSGGSPGVLLISFFLIIIVLGFVLFGFSNLSLWVGAIAVIIILSLSIGINSQWEEAIILRLGQFNRTVEAGLYFKIPILESAIKRDMRTTTEKLERQEVITKDNISVFIDTVLFLKVSDSKKSIIAVDDYRYAMFQYAQTAMRSHIGQSTLDDLLSKREAVAKTIAKDINEHISRWGVSIVNLEIQDISLPKNMKRVMARQAEAEREKRGVIIASEGEVIAAKNLDKASRTLGHSKFGMKLRELTTIKDVSADGNSVIFYPTEMGMKTASAALSKSRKKPKE
jgi:regulator of protease activity HflC (stomatin/prohibitin superfamily)